MLRRIYVDNFRCFVNFELELERKILLLGMNGSGKTSVFDLLSSLRQFVVEGALLEDVFASGTVTRWQNLPEQTFELEIEGNGGTYLYRLKIEHEATSSRSRVLLEQVTFSGKTIFSFQNGEVHLYNDRFEDKVQHSFDWTRSGFGTVQDRRENTILTWLKEWFRGLYCVRVDPIRMSARSEKEAVRPRSDLSNFADWYRHLVQESSGQIVELHTALREALDGFESLNAREAGQNTRILKARFESTRGRSSSDNSSDPPEFEFGELSDGQRSLIALYTVLEFAVRKDRTVLLDEPDNFLALPELQPWLLQLLDRVDDRNSQVIIVSHHPELMNQLAMDCGLVLSREGCGPVRARKYQSSSDGTLAPSEEIARGWTDA